MRVLHAVLASALLSCASVVGAFARPFPDLAIYGGLPGVEAVSISPNGDRVAMVGMVEGVRRLVVLDQDKKPLTAVPMDDAKLRGIYWAGNDRVLVYKSDATKLGPGFIGDRVELFTMVVVPLNGEKLWAVFDHEERIPGGVQRFLGVQERDGHTYGYFGAIALDGDFRSSAYLKSTAPVLYEVDLQSRKVKQIADRGQRGYYRDWVLGPDGVVCATLDFDVRSGDWVVRNAAGLRIAEGRTPSGQIDLVGLGATPGTVVLAQGVGATEPVWSEVPLAGGASKTILGDASFDDVFIDPKSRTLTGYREAGSRSSYVFFDPLRQAVVKATMKAFAGYQVTLKGWDDSFDRLVVTTEGNGDAQTWWVVDVKSGKARDIGYAYPLEPEDVGDVQVVTYKAGDGLEIEGMLTLPPGRPARALPVVILPHGGPAARDYPGFDWWAQALASRGYAVLQPNFRGSTGYGAAFRSAGNGEWGRKMQSDLSDGLAYLAGKGIVDPKRACIAGASYGGYAALAGVTLQSGLFRCAVAVSAVSDVAKWAASEIIGVGYNETAKRAFAEILGEGRDLAAISPINFAAQVGAPVLLIHGKDDTVVPYAQSTAIAAELRKAGKAVELVTLPGEDHWLSRSATRLGMLQATLAFIMKHNPPDPAP